MADNLAYQGEWRTETHNGEIVYMSPRPAVNHNRVSFNIARAFGNYLDGKPCEPFSDGTEVHLTDNDCVVPDVMIVCNKDVVKRSGIFGAPDLIVEVLSFGTQKNDRGYKKDLYEKCGVKEYWLVDPENRTVEVYLLTDGKFNLDEIYQVPPDYVELSIEEKQNHRSSVRVSLYDDFSVPLDTIFRNLF